MMKSMTKNQNGFTLIELLIALVIFAVGILGVATMQLTSIKGNSHGRQISEASNQMSSLIETFKSIPFDDAMLHNDDGDDDGVDDDDGIADIADLTNPDGQLVIDGYNLVWNVANDSPAVGLKQIRIFVSSPTNRMNQFSFDIIRSEIE